MAGHSKWAQIKRKKAVNDSKKGAVFTRVAKNIAIAAKQGKDPDMNAALRTAIDQAKAVNMPKENIEKAILKGAGELPGVSYEEMLYEGYGPYGVACIIECVTDNTNRSVSFVRSTLTKYGGSLGSSGSVLYLFEQKGVIRIAASDFSQHAPEDIELYAIDAGADDIVIEEEGMIILTARTQLEQLRAVLSETGIVPTTSTVEWFTKNRMALSDEEAEKIAELVEILEENEDVQAVYTNAA